VGMCAPSKHLQEAKLTGHDYLRSLGVELVPTSAPDFFTTDTPTAVLVRQVLGAISKFEKASLVAVAVGASHTLRRFRKSSRWCASCTDSGNRCGRYRRRWPHKVTSLAEASLTRRRRSGRCFAADRHASRRGPFDGVSRSTTRGALNFGPPQAPTAQATGMATRP
jgi:hypothetical protein